MASESLILLFISCIEQESAGGSNNKEALSIRCCGGSHTLLREPLDLILILVLR